MSCLSSPDADVLLRPTRIIPPKAPSIVNTSTNVILSFSQTHASRAMKKGVAFIITKKIDRGRYSMATTKHRKVIEPLTHLVTRIGKFYLSMLAVRLSLAMTRKIDEAMKLYRLRKKVSSKDDMFSCLVRTVFVHT